MLRDELLLSKMVDLGSKVNIGGINITIFHGQNLTHSKECERLFNRCFADLNKNLTNSAL
jgi:hypothetical protein